MKTIFITGIKYILFFVRGISALSCIAPLLATIYPVTLIILGSIKYGMLPKYGIHPDPGALGFEFELFGMISMASLLGWLCSIPYVFIVLVLLLLDKAKPTRAEAYCIVLNLCCMMANLLMHLCMSESVTWAYD